MSRHTLVLIGIYGLSILLVLVTATLWWRADDMRTIVRPSSIGDGELSTDMVRLYASFFGSQAMFEYFGHGISDLTIGPQHRAAHIVGQVLYEREGLDAIAICNGAFTFGCLHQIVGLTSVEFGSASSTALIDVCHDTTGLRYDTCAHSVGHGLVNSIGYDPEHLEQALTICDGIHTQSVGKIQSCYAGVFMEYNMRLMIYQYPNPREVGGESPRALCDELADPLHQRLCIFWMIPWLHAVQYEYSYQPRIFSEMGSICQTLKQPLRDECFQSIGRTLTISGSTPVNYAHEQCKNASETDTDIEACVLWAARSYYLAEREGRARDICARLPKKNVQSCIDYAFAKAATP